MNAEEVRRILRSACENRGGQKNFAEFARVSQQYVSDVLNGKREPGEAILDALNIERVVTYRYTYFDLDKKNDSPTQ